ncbi:MAG: hypothetical protein J6J93_06690 [Muribaculaceae bacterium]|nr:hypothetical protein [Muribaculaceae bacterium]
MRLLIISILIFLGIASYAIKYEVNDFIINPDQFNRLDSLGRRIGQWILTDPDSASCIVVNYMNGKKEGVKLIYDVVLRTKDSDTIKHYLQSIITYADGKYHGTITEFYENGLPFFLIRDIEPIKDFNPTPKGYSEEFKFEYQGYTVEYNQDGTISDEGYMIFNDDYIIDFQEVGLWKYYDDSGNCIRTKDYGEYRK